MNNNPKISKQDMKRKKAFKSYLKIKRDVFFGVLFLVAVLGIIIPLRPTVSTIEKRTLTTFPEFTWQSFIDGTYFNGISTWYADTFPFREALLTANSAVKGLYGLQSEQLVGNSDKTGDDIPDTPVLPSSDETTEATTESATTEETTEEQLPDGAIHDIPEASGNVYVTGDTAFGLYYFSTDGANAYVNMIDKAQKKLDGVANVYDILVPTSFGIMLDENAQEAIGSSNQEKAIDYIYSSINSVNENITTVNAYDTLKNHNSEYIYFRTDHHWTALGAYYTYVQFCNAKGIEPTPLDEYETIEFPGFVGTFYSSSNQAPSLLENPDTVTAYYPKTTNDMYYIGSDLSTIQWNIIMDVTGWDRASLYSCFAAGDEIYAQIDNPNVNNGQSCVVIKESYGNAFIPFLADHYEHIYIVDYRYFYKYPDYNNSVYQLVTENDVDDVIFINNADAMTNPNAAELMSDMFN